MEVCRLCLLVSKSSSYSKLTDPYKCIVNSLIPEVNLDITINPSICHQCSHLVNKLHEFKLACFECHQQQRKQPFQPGCCHTCSRPIENPFLQDVSDVKSILQFCMPEMDFHLPPEPEVCRKCLVRLQRLQQLKTSYLTVEEKLNSFVVDAKRPIDLGHLVHGDDERQMHSGDKDRGWLEMESPSKLDGIMQDVLQRQKEEFLYSCSQCTCTMPNRRHYVMHMLTTHTTFSQTTRSRHLCHLCQFQTNDQNDMKKHIEFEHTQKVKLNCPFCSFASFYALNLRRHISIHEQMQNLTCSHAQCDFKTSYKHSLRRHELKMHRNQCSVCHYKSKTRSLVQKHLRTEHGMYEQFQCVKCRFVTFQLTELRKHNVKIHRRRSKSKFTVVMKAKDQLTVEEEEQVNTLFD